MCNLAPCPANPLRQPLIESPILIETVSVVFQTMMGLDIVPVEAAGSDASRGIVARIFFSGSWRGALMLETPPPLACFFAARFLTMDAPQSVDSDVRDVLGEIVNIISGNVKCGLPSGAMLSTPEVLDVPDFGTGVAHTISQTQAFSCCEGCFRISLVPRPS